jgi:hypothetical protein
VDGLTTEEMFPFVTRVLENANNWMVHTTALLLRSRLESNKSRTVERSALQLQALVDQFDLKDEGSVEERLEWFYSLLVPAKWEMEVSCLSYRMFIRKGKSWALWKPRKGQSDYGVRLSVFCHFLWSHLRNPTCDDALPFISKERFAFFGNEFQDLGFF